MDTTFTRRSEVRANLQAYLSNSANDLPLSLIDSPLKHCLEVVGERSASTWLTALPLTGYGFALYKGTFCDDLCLRYGWTPSQFPTPSIVFVALPFLLIIPWISNLVVFHQLDILKFTILQHIFSQRPAIMLLLNIYYSNCMEKFCLIIQPITRTRPKLTLLQEAFGILIKELFSMWEFQIHLLALTQQDFISVMSQEKRDRKTRSYEERITSVEHKTFTSLVFTMAGGIAPVATVFFTRACFHDFKDTWSAILLCTSLDQMSSGLFTDLIFHLML